MKKILLIGPIGGRYGRDIEVNLVAKALYKKYDLSFFSTGIWSKNSSSIKGIKSPKYASLNSLLLRIPFLFVLTFTSYIHNNFKTRFEQCVYNKINSKLINKYNIVEKILYQQIKDKDIIICFVQLSSAYLKDIIEISKKNNSKVIIRTTGTINSLDISISTLKKVDLFIHHSEFNKKRLSNLFKHKNIIIDQASSIEKKLLEIKPIKIKDNITFGYIGRFNKLKRVDEIIDVAIQLNLNLVIAGNGEDKDIFEKINKSNSIINLGFLEYNEINQFYNQIDILIINSEHETGPLTGLEAMCAGRYIISTKVGAMPERLKQNENTWIENDLSTTVNKFLRLDKNNIEKKALMNRNIYLKNYSLCKVQNKYINAIESITNA